MKFRSRGIVGDIALLVLLLPVAAAALTFLFGFLVVIASALLGLTLTDTTTLAVSAVFAVALLLFIVAWTSYWTITLDDEAMVIGTLWRRRIPYDRVAYVSAGAMDDALTRLRSAKPDVVPMAIVTGLFSKWRLFLAPDDADRCVRELYTRSPNAGALDTTGKTYAPRNRLARRPAQIRMAEALAVRAIGAFFLAAAGVLTIVLLYHQYSTPAGTGIERLRWTADEFRFWGLALTLVPLIPAAITYGVVTVRKLRRTLGGQFDQD